MQSLNIKEWKLLDCTKITHCKHPKGDVDVMLSKFNTHLHIIKIKDGVDITLSKFNTPKNKLIFSNVPKKRGSLQHRITLTLFDANDQLGLMRR